MWSPKSVNKIFPFVAKHKPYKEFCVTYSSFKSFLHFLDVQTSFLDVEMH